MCITKKTALITKKLSCVRNYHFVSHNIHKREDQEPPFIYAQINLKIYIGLRKQKMPT